MAEADYAPPITERFGGEDVAFPRLLMREYAVLENQVRSNHAAKVRQWADESGLRGKDRAEYFAQNDAMFVTDGMVAGYLRTNDGARKALELSLTKAGKTPEQIVALFEGREALDAFNLAMALVGFALRVTLEDVVGGDPRPLPAGGSAQ